MNSEDSRPFFLERCENGFNSMVTKAELDDLEMQRASPYAFHLINENLEFVDYFLTNEISTHHITVDQLNHLYLSTVKQFFFSFDLHCD